MTTTRSRQNRVNEASHGSPRPSENLNRREFLKMAAVTGVVLVTQAQSRGGETGNGMTYRLLGKTGEKVSAVGLGGYHIGVPREEAEGIRIIRSAIDRGLNFMDNCWDYHAGDSEVRMGKALRDGYRQKVFLMTKIDGRTKTAASKQLEESLRRLQTDHIDLLQFHEVIRMEDAERVFAPDGGMEAILEARKAGKVRFIGFTGHKDPSIHLHMLDVAADHQFRFDAVQMPLNVMDAHFRSFQHQVLPRLVKDGIGVLGMKPMGSGVILTSKTVGPLECLHYVMNLPTSTVITGIDRMDLLDQALEAVRTFRPMSEQEVSALLARTTEAAASGRYEPFKIGEGFDATSRNRQWLG